MVFPNATLQVNLKVFGLLRAEDTFLYAKNFLMVIHVTDKDKQEDMAAKQFVFVQPPVEEMCTNIEERARHAIIDLVEPAFISLVYYAA